MKTSKIKFIQFEFYRYQINPFKLTQLSLFGENISYKELKKIKNTVFAEKILSIDSKIQTHKGEYFLKLTLSQNNLFVYKLASKKSIEAHNENLEEIVIEDYPYVHVIIDNSPNIQKIGISRNYKAFSDTNTVNNILQTYFSDKLYEHNLTYFAKPIIDKLDFWKILQKHENRITQIRFEIIKNNLTNISASLNKATKAMMNATNSTKTKIELNAPPKGVLENINKENEVITSLSDYSNEGGGDVDLKVKGIKRRVKTNEAIKQTSVDELNLKGGSDDVIKVFNEIMEK